MLALAKRLNLRPDSIISGASVAIIGIFILVAAAPLSLGGIASIGPGFFPVVIGWMLIGIGVLLVFFDTSGSQQETAGDTHIDLRALFFISLSILSFIMINMHYGLFPAVLSTILVSSLASKVISIRARLVISVVGAVFAVVVFVYVLGLNFPVFKGIR